MRKNNAAIKTNTTKGYAVLSKHTVALERSVLRSKLRRKWPGECRPE
jgi:hypothetical protein